jgi:hypothetical protein
MYHISRFQYTIFICLYIIISFFLPSPHICLHWLLGSSLASSLLICLQFKRTIRPTTEFLLAHDIMQYKTINKRRQPRKRKRRDLPSKVENHEDLQRQQPIVIEDNNEEQNEEDEEGKIQDRKIKRNSARWAASSASSSSLSDPPDSDGRDVDEAASPKKKLRKNRFKHTRFPDVRQDDGTTKYWTIGRA